MNGAPVGPFRVRIDIKDEPVLMNPPIFARPDNTYMLTAKVHLNYPETKMKIVCTPSFLKSQRLYLDLDHNNTQQRPLGFLH